MTKLTAFQKEDRKGEIYLKKSYKQDNEIRKIKGEKLLFLYEFGRRKPRPSIKVFKSKVEVKKSRVHYLEKLDLVKFFDKNKHIQDVRVKKLDGNRYYTVYSPVLYYNNYVVTGIEFMKKGKIFFRSNGEIMPLKKHTLINCINFLRDEISNAYYDEYMQQYNRD